MQSPNLLPPHMNLDMKFIQANWNAEPAWLASIRDDDGEVIGFLHQKALTPELALTGLLYKLVEYINRKSGTND